LSFGIELKLWCNIQICIFFYGIFVLGFNTVLLNMVHLSSPQVFSGVRVARSLVLCVMFCRSLFVLLSLFFCPLCYLSFLDLWFYTNTFFMLNNSYIKDQRKKRSLMLQELFLHTFFTEIPIWNWWIGDYHVFRLLTDFVCLYTYEFWLSLCKIVRSSVILLLPLLVLINGYWYFSVFNWGTKHKLW
jgi:hypothetical protein